MKRTNAEPLIARLELDPANLVRAESVVDGPPFEVVFLLDGSPVYFERKSRIE